MAGRPLHVLLVEDDATEAELIADLLRRARREAFELERVDRLSTALARIEHGGIDTVLLDFSLPDSAGLDTFRRLRTSAPTVPAVILTDIDDEEVAYCAVREGAQDYLLKRELTSAVLARAVRYAVERVRAEERLLHDAFHDALTGLPNRSLFIDRMGVALEQSRRRHGLAFAVLFLDLDRFKNLNDSLGHAAGDALLVESAARLRACVRPGDTVARLGGDEFGILLAEVTTPEDATRVAERVLDALARPFRIGPHDVVVTASIGITPGSATYASPDELLRDADTAMYRAKAAGRACFQVFDQAMHSSVAALLKLEMDLRRAVERSSFVMHYQPIVSLEAGRIVGFEGLVRWLDPERGLVLPASFIAVAEETGLIVPIGWWALRETCAQVRRWQQAWPLAPTLYASVNVSGRIFGASDIVERVSRLLNETGLPPASLRLEITESILMDHCERALEILERLRALGVQFSIDDFGTGYSSLSYLQRFSYDTLKIDRSFIAGMREKADVGAIVQTIVGLGSRLGMGVVAEGVETEGQYRELKAMRCPAAQGFWFSPPVEAATAEALISGQQLVPT